MRPPTCPRSAHLNRYNSIVELIICLGWYALTIIKGMAAIVAVQHSATSPDFDMIGFPVLFFRGP